MAMVVDKITGEQLIMDTVDATLSGKYWINPKMPNCETKYVKDVDGFPVEMTPEEKEGVDKKDVDAYRAARILALKDSGKSALHSKWDATVDEELFALDSDAYPKEVHDAFVADMVAVFNAVQTRKSSLIAATTQAAIDAVPASFEEVI